MISTHTLFTNLKAPIWFGCHRLTAVLRFSSVLIVGCCLNQSAAHSATITAASTSRADVSAAIASSSAGDTVIIPAGASTWFGSVVVTKGITIVGAGTNNTLLINSTSADRGLETGLFEISLSADEPLRISGIYFQDSGVDRNSDGVQINGTPARCRRIRIYDCLFEGFTFAIKHYGAFGVVHNCTFLNNLVSARNAGYVSTSALGGLSAPPWAWGSANYFVFEDCVFQLTNWTIDTYMMDTEYPCNYLVRYCTFNIHRSSAVVADGFDMHGNSAGSLNNLGIVIYKNTFNYTGNRDVVKFTDIRGGVGSLVYSNIVNGVNCENVLRDDPFALPLLAETYLWANVDSDGTHSYRLGNGVAQGVNYFLFKPAGFAQLQYPHPLRTGSGSSTNPVSSITSASHDFGPVLVGSTNDVTFTVRNAGGGILAGSVSVSLPFSILGNNSYSLVSNASQVVTVRYVPTSPGTHGQTITFAGGGGASASVSGSAWNSVATLAFDSTAGTINSPFTVNADQTVSQSVETADPANGGRAVYGFNITTAGDYLVSANVSAPSAEADSLFVNIDAEPVYPTMIWDVPTYSGFTNRTVTWRGSGGPPPQTWSLGVGTHQLIIRGREAGLKIGRITIIPYGQAVPTSRSNLRIEGSN